MAMKKWVVKAKKVVSVDYPNFKCVVNIYQGEDGNVYFNYGNGEHCPLYPCVLEKCSDQKCSECSDAKIFIIEENGQKIPAYSLNVLAF
jgi:hypothetical protein